MARKQITQYFDDLDGSPLTDDSVYSVAFAIDGNDYLIDLSEHNAEEFRTMMKRYIDAAQKIPSSAASSQNRRRSTGKKVDPELSRRVRVWGRLHNYSVADRGKIPSELWQAYMDNHPEERPKG